MNKSSYIQIFETSDYDQFINILGNRHLNESRVNKLIESIKKKNLLHFAEIDVNERMEVIDGQHRLEAAKRLNVPIYFKICQGLSIEDVLSLNVNQWNWILSQYLQSYVDRGIADYKILALFVETYNLPISVSMKLLSGLSPSTSYHEERGVNHTQRFKEGKFKIADGALKSAEVLALQLTELKPYCKNQLWGSGAFISAMQQAYKTIKHVKLIQKLKTHGKIIEKRNSIKEYLRQIEDIYNFHAMHNGSVRIF